MPDPLGILQRAAEKVIKAAGFSVNEQVVSTLLPSAERLRELRDEFGPMIVDQNWMIHSFQEQLGVLALGGHKAGLCIILMALLTNCAGRRGHPI